MNVVMVHGIFDTGWIFNKIRRKLNAAGHQCFIATLKPNLGTCKLELLATNLKQQINQHFGQDTELAIIGFSMGAIISQVYIQEQQGDQRTHSFFSISGPHNGTITAYLHPGIGAQQMRPRSQLLQRLAASQHKLDHIHKYSYYTPYDFMIIPAYSSKWKGSQTKRINAPLHQLMVHNNTLIMDIINKLEC